MSVQVTVDPNLPLFNFCQLLHKPLDTEDLWVEVLVRIYPLPIEVNSGDRVPVVATDDSIRVQTRH